MSGPLVIGGVDWLVALREGVFARRPPIPKQPQLRRVFHAKYVELLPLADYHGQACPYCGMAMVIGGRRRPTREHVIPRSRGGKLTNGNRLIVCSPCNSDKGDMTLEQFAQHLVDAADRRAAFVIALLETGADR